MVMGILGGLFLSLGELRLRGGQLLLARRQPRLRLLALAPRVIHLQPHTVP